LCGFQEVQQFRSILEPALSTAGTDIASGALVWEPYRRLEVEEFEEQAEAATAETVTVATEAKKFVIANVYTRQLATPLLGNEKVLAELEGFLSEHCDASEVDIIKPDELQQKYESAISLRKTRIPFEERVLLAGGDDKGAAATDRKQAWMDYIHFEVREKCYDRVERLYERAIMDCPSCQAELFGLYLTFTAENSKNWRLLEDISKRALIVEYNNVNFWRYRFLAIELANAGDVKTKMDECFSLAQAAGFTSPMDYLCVMNLYCDFYRRRLAALASQEAGSLGDLGNCVDQTRSAFDAAEAFLQRYYPTWFEGYYSIVKYRISVEDSVIADISESLSSSSPIPIVPNTRDVWERLIATFGKATATGAGLWVEYVKWAFQATRDVGICRKLLRRASVAMKDPAAAVLIHAEMLRLEQQHGTSAQEVLSAVLKCGSLAPSYASITQPNNSTFEGPAPITGSSIPLAPPSATTQASAEVVQSTAKREREGNEPSEASEPANPIKKAKLPMTSESSEATAAMPTTAAIHEQAGHTSASLYVKNISFSLSEEEFLAPFRAIGEIVSYEMLKSENGKFNGMAIVTFATSEVAALALKNLSGYSFGHRKITLDFYHPPGNSGSNSETQYNEEGGKFHPTTLFVSKLPSRAGEADVSAYFGSFGTIRLARMLVDKNTGESKVSSMLLTTMKTIDFLFLFDIMQCRALVEFDAEDALQRAMAFRGHSILNETVFVTRSKFPAAAPEKKATVPSQASGEGSGRRHEAVRNDTRASESACEPTSGKKLVALGLKPRVLRK
jgi:RNA recognition motif-containing protein